jgi:hypothetical protein
LSAGAESAATEQQLLEVLRRVAATIPALREGVARILAAAELAPINERMTSDPADDKFVELTERTLSSPAMRSLGP